MIPLINRPAVAPTPANTIRLTDKQTIAANLRLESAIHETFPYDARRALREIKEQMTIANSSPDIARFHDISSHKWGN